MLLEVIALTALMMTVTYLWRPAGAASHQRRARFQQEASPFSGRTQTTPISGYHTIDKGSMTRCHQCGCFFPISRVVHDIVEGHLLEFCSQECRRNFLSPRR